MSRPLSRVKAEPEPLADPTAPLVVQTNQKILDLEKDKAALLTRLKDLEKKYEDEIDGWRRTVEEIKGQKSLSSEQAEKLETLERRIISLYIEIKIPRDGSDVVEAEIAKQRDELKRLSPMVILDYLRAHVRTVLALKEDSEVELQKELEATEIQFNKEMKELRRRLKIAEEQAEEAKATLELALGQSEEAQMVRDQIARDSKAQIADLKNELFKLQEQLKKKEEQIVSAEGTAHEKEKVIRNLEFRLMRIVQLENHVQEVQHSEKREQEKMKATHQRELAGLTKNLGRVTQLECDNAILRKQLSEATDQIIGFRANYNKHAMDTMEATVSKCQKTLSFKEEELSRTLDELSFVRSVAQELERKNLQLKAEYDKIFQAVNNSKNSSENPSNGKTTKTALYSDPKNIQRTDEEVKRLAAENPHFVEFYKYRFKEKERECRKLAARVKRLLAKENTVMLMEERFESEKQQLLDQLAKEARLRRPGSAATATSPSPQFSRPYSAQSMFETPGGNQSSILSDGEDDDDDDEDEFENEILFAAGGSPISVKALELKRKNRELQEKLRQFENMETISVTTASAYKRLISVQDSNGSPMSPGSSMSPGPRSVFDLSDNTPNSSYAVGSAVQMRRSAFKSKIK